MLAEFLLVTFFPSGLYPQRDILVINYASDIVVAARSRPLCV